MNYLFTDPILVPQKVPNFIKLDTVPQNSVQESNHFCGQYISYHFFKKNWWNKTQQSKTVSLFIEWLQKVISKSIYIRLDTEFMNYEKKPAERHQCDISRIKYKYSVQLEAANGERVI